MANFALNEIWRLRVACYTSTQASINVVHFRVTHALGQVTDSSAVGTMDNLIASAYKAVLSDDARYRGCSLQRVFPTPPTRPAVSVAADGPGSVAGEILPGQVAGIVSAKTAFAGKSQRARVYLAFPAETDNELPGLPTDTYVAAATLLGNRLFQVYNFPITPGVNEATLTPVVLHRANMTTDVITDKAAKKLWATQKRRGSYGRHNLPPF